MKKRLYERLLEYAKKNPEGFSVYIKNGKIRSFNATSKRRYIISKTNNNTITKIKQSFRNDNYTGYAGGWHDKKSNKYYIDKNIVLGDMDKAKKIALKHNQLAIFDLLQLKEIRIQKEHKKSARKIKLPAIRKNKKWYNTITKKYISETYAKRLNNYFRKHPEKSLHEATGHGKYYPKKSFPEHSKQIRKLAYGKGSQIIKTKTVKGKTVYYSPFTDERLTSTEAQKLKKLDYTICNDKVLVELFRFTRDKINIYHVLTWKIFTRFPSPYTVDVWYYSEGRPIFNCIKRELKKIVKRYRFSKITIMYGHVSTYFYSKLDGWEQGKTFGFVIPNQKGFDMLTDEFEEILEYYKDRLEVDAYHNIYLQRFSFYIYDSRQNATKNAKLIAKYRLGINRIG